MIRLSITSVHIAEEHYRTVIFLVNKRSADKLKSKITHRFIFLRLPLLLFLLPRPPVILQPDLQDISHLQHILTRVGFKTDYRDADTLLKFKQVHGFNCRQHIILDHHLAIREWILIF